MVQDLRYTYDAVGNITTVQDEAQQTVFFNNTMIQPRQEYTYDALYRLVEAKGREKIGIATQGEDRWDDMPWMGEWMPNADPNQLQNYTQTYTYDEAGNMLQLQHQAPNGGYTRDYTIHSTNNQLLSTHIGSDTYSHSYDVLGNMLTMAHLNAMDYNLENSLAHIQRGTDEAFYQYRAGQRSRKIVQKQGNITEERIYLGSYEIFRIFAGSSLNLERKTVHVSDDAGRIGMYEYRTQGNDNSPQELMRYVYSNNIQSSNLELDENGEIISYEEYHPFGTTSYQATNAQINAVAKRYRYTGKERDEESGLYYHGARYYIPWLCRWTQCDPIGIKDGLNVYAYCSNNPVMLNDPSGMNGSGGTEEERPKATSDAQKAYEEGEKKTQAEFQKSLDEISNSNAHPEFKQWMSDIGLEGVTKFRDALFQSGISSYQNEMARKMYGSNSDGSVAVPEAIRQRLWTEANQNAISTLKAAWAAEKSNYDPSKFLDAINPFAQANYLTTLALTVTNKAEGMKLAKGVGLQVALQWALHLSGGGVRNLTSTVSLIKQEVKTAQLFTKTNISTIEKYLGDDLFKVGKEMAANNVEMIKRMRLIQQGKIYPTAQDINFVEHELFESNMVPKLMKEGLSKDAAYTKAHSWALDKYGIKDPSTQIYTKHAWSAYEDQLRKMK